MILFYVCLFIVFFSGELIIIIGLLERHHEEKIKLLKDQEFVRSQHSEHHFTEMMEMIDDIRRSQ